MTRDELIERLDALTAEMTGDDLIFAKSVIHTLIASLLGKSDRELADITAAHSQAKVRASRARWN